MGDGIPVVSICKITKNHKTWVVGRIDGWKVLLLIVVVIHDH